VTNQRPALFLYVLRPENPAALLYPQTFENFDRKSPATEAGNGKNRFQMTRKEKFRYFTCHFFFLISQYLNVSHLLVIFYPLPLISRFFPSLPCVSRFLDLPGMMMVFRHFFHVRRAGMVPVENTMI
jgi:hypothetical protein